MVCHIRFPFSFQHFYTGQTHASIGERRMSIGKDYPPTNTITYFTKSTEHALESILYDIYISGLDPKIPTGKVRSYLRLKNRPVYDLLVECFGE